MSKAKIETRGINDRTEHASGPPFTAVLLGATAIKPGRVNAWGTVIAVAVLAVTRRIESAWRAVFVEALFNGATLIVALGLAVTANKRQMIAGSVADAVQVWIAAVGARTAYIGQGSPWENGDDQDSISALSRRELLAEAFRKWERALTKGLAAMRDRGELASAANLQDLTAAILSALQGGILLTQTTRDARPLELALDMAITLVERAAPRRGT